MTCPKCKRSDRVVQTDAKGWWCCMRCSLPIQSKSPRQLEQERRAETAQRRLGNR